MLSINRKDIILSILSIGALILSYIYHMFGLVAIFFLVTLFIILPKKVMGIQRVDVILLIVILAALGLSYVYHMLELGIISSFILLGGRVYFLIRSETTKTIDKKMWDAQGETRIPPGLKKDESNREN